MGAVIDKLLFPVPLPRPAFYAERERDNSIQKFATLQTETGSEIVACHIDLGFPVTVLYSHGNAEDMTHTVPWLTRQICPRFKVNAICYDYSGYGFGRQITSWTRQSVQRCS